MSELAKALVEAQKEMPEVPKKATANYGNYATLDDLISKTRPVLNEHGLSIQQFPHVSELGAPVLRTIIRHTSGETEQADTPLFLQKQDMQALGAAITYARRYAWGAVLGIASEHDDDAQSISNGAKPAETEERPRDAHGYAESRADATTNGTTGDATDKQKAMVARLAKKLGLDAGNVDALSKRDASAKIEELLNLEKMGVEVAAGGGGDADSDIPFARTFT